MCVGLAKTDAMIRSAAAGPGNLLVIMGASTGRDGIGGASVLASAELEAGDDSKRPSVQIGDPFEESKLLECCLELLERGLLVSLQDLGAAGLTSSAGEMASKGGVGIDIDVRQVPLREQDIEPFEVMVSESQERMLAVVEPSRLDEVVATCERWQTGSAAIGEITDSGHLRVLDDGVEVGDVPVSALVDECPLYDLEPEEPGGWMYGNSETLGELVAERRPLRRPAIPRPSCALLGAPNVASKRWAFEQYDSVVGSRTARRPESADAAVLMIPESDRAIAVAIDGNGRRVACDPYAGAVEAVLECAQNLACVGAEPLGLTNCLNFGNPEKPNVAWQLDRAVLGLADACLALRVPVVGGNVSLYNETEHGPIYPTPVVGMVGELPDAAGVPGLAPSEGDRLVLVGPFAPSLAGSELAKQRGELDSGLPQVPLDDVDDGASALVREPGPRGRGHRRPRRQRRRARLRAGRDGDRGRDRAWMWTSIRSSSCAAARARRTCSARVPAESCSRPRRRRRGAAGARRGGRGRGGRARHRRGRSDLDRGRRAGRLGRARRRRARLALARPSGFDSRIPRRVGSRRVRLGTEMPQLLVHSRRQARSLARPRLLAAIALLLLPPLAKRELRLLGEHRSDDDRPREAQRDRGEQRFIKGLTNVHGVAVDSKHIYWTQGSGATSSIGRANLDGSGANRNFIPNSRAGVNFAAASPRPRSP